ncbi:hypothetical protein GOP47_0024729 [Adiantum capillus-veneris]|uniref:Uncharacterized protein n=1 Tax=Adiantum capillus-veneris TaxID=13818 RepID=A0A9D4Z3X1_ADICA|nr:hypothetical protein GOP47_0024729 [Adiantum capillus-veneris]
MTAFSFVLKARGQQNKRGRGDKDSARAQVTIWVCDGGCTVGQRRPLIHGNKDLGGGTMYNGYLWCFINANSPRCCDGFEVAGSEIGRTTTGTWKARGGKEVWQEVRPLTEGTRTTAGTGKAKSLMHRVDEGRLSAAHGERMLKCSWTYRSSTTEGH